MNVFARTTLITFALVLAAGSATAQDTMKNMQKDGIKQTAMTMEQCKAHMAMSKKGGTAKDNMTTRKDTECNEMMAKHGGMASTGMSKDGMAHSTMTMAQCKDHMAMSKKGGAAKDDMTTRKDTECSEMMTKQGNSTAEPMKK